MPKEDLSLYVRLSPNALFSREALFPSVQEKPFTLEHSAARTPRARRRATPERTAGMAPNPAEQPSLF